MRMSRTAISLRRERDPLQATTRLRAGILVAPSGEDLVVMFAQALSEHGIAGHFCVRGAGAALQPILGDTPELVARPEDCLVIPCNSLPGSPARMLLAQPEAPLEPAEMARVRGYSELYAARAIALQELEDDVDTGCGLTLRERYVLGRRLAGQAPVDIAAESGLSVPTVAAALDGATKRLGDGNEAAAIALAARRGWLAVTSLENCSSSSEKLTYKAIQNG